MFPEARVFPADDNDRRYTTHDTIDLCSRCGQMLESLSSWRQPR